jgi:hypothetical protein
LDLTVDRYIKTVIFDHCWLNPWLASLHNALGTRLNSSHRLNALDGFRKSTLPQNLQLIVDYYGLKQKVDGFVGELTRTIQLIYCVK